MGAGQYARVLGEFPQQGEDSLFRQSWLHGWRAAEVEDPGSGMVDVGIDVAGPGKSETVAAVRQDGDLLELQAWPSSDPRGERRPPPAVARRESAAAADATCRIYAESIR